MEDEQVILNSSTPQTSTSESLNLEIIMMIYVVIALLCAIASAFIAKHNDRSGVAAFITGFLFGPFGVMTYMIMGESLELRAEIMQQAERNLNKHS